MPVARGNGDCSADPVPFQLKLQIGLCVSDPTGGESTEIQLEQKHWSQLMSWLRKRIWHLPRRMVSRCRGQARGDCLLGQGHLDFESKPSVLFGSKLKNFTFVNFMLIYRRLGQAERLNANSVWIRPANRRPLPMGSRSAGRPVSLP